MAEAMRLRGDLNLKALEQALRELVARHESLRTRFVEVDGEPVQIVDSDRPIALKVEDLAMLKGTAQEDAVTAALRRETELPFDLGRGPLLRMTLLRLGESEHVLLWKLHHIISDGWSVGVFKKELAALYKAFCKGLSNPLEPLPIQYADFAVWQSQRLQGETLKWLFAYWTRKLEGAPPLLALLADRPRTSQYDHSVGKRALDVPPELAASVSALCQREGVTLFMLLLGAFKVLLARCSGQEDIVVGTPSAGRDRVELEGLIGFFINTVVLRTDLSCNPTFQELLTRVRTTVLEAFEHQDLPFDKLVEELHLERDLSHSPLFQVFFNMPTPEISPVSFSGLETESVIVPEPEARFDLTLYATEEGRKIRLCAVYKTELFRSESIERMLDQYLHLLEQIVTAPQKSINKYSLVTAAARALLPDPRVPIEVRTQQPVADQVLKWAQTAPKGVSVIAGGRHWTYAELTSRATSLSMALQEMRIGRGDVVAIIGPRGFGLVGTMLGILMSGGAFLTIDPTLPAERKRVMLREARVKVVCLIGQPGDSDDILEALPVLRADSDLSLLRGPVRTFDRACSLPANHGDAPAYVFFTSGSTGQPKAILGCHQGLSHFLHWQRNTFAIGSEDRVSQLIGLTFDPLLRDVFLPLTSGATLCVPTESDLLDTIGWIKRDGITVVHTTPTVMQSWLISVERPIELESLRWLFISGEPLSDVLISNWRQKVRGPAQLVNLYGPTETTMVRCFYPVPGEIEQGIQPIGFSLPESQALVLNAMGALCGIGETGEIALRTPYRSLGYLNLPEENQRRFRPNPFRNDASDLVYFTGDRGRYRADGLLEIAGRLDDQIKIHGVLVEPGEVAATLARHEAVHKCFVIGRTDAHGEHYLVGYVVPKPGNQLDARSLRAYLTERLPGVFVPKLFVFLDALPVLPNGKVDRRALPAPQQERASLGLAYVAPRNSLEEVVAGVWREVLKLEQVGVHDNFFQLGGHSLLAVQVVARLAKLLRIELPLRRFFEQASVSALAEALQRLLGAREVAPIVPVPRTGKLPLSFAQQRLWFLDRLLPQKGVYNVPTLWRLSGGLDVEALRRSLQTLVERHEVLRTCFAVREDEPEQVIGALSAVALPVTDLSALPQSEREARARELAEAAAHQPFDIDRGPLLRAQLLRLAPEEHLFLVNVHHIASDGWSMGVLWRELSSAYDAFASRRMPELPSLPIQYADYAVWQRKWLQGEVLEGQLEYWKNKLADVSLLELPTDRPHPPVASYNGKRVVFDLPGPLVQGLKELSRREGATLFMTLLASFQVLLHRYSGQEDIAVGTPMAGRGRTELEGLIGFLVNTLVLRTDLAGNPAFTELLGRVRESALAAYTHQSLPFEKLVEELSPSRDLSRSPLFQVMFVLQNAPGAALALHGVEASRLPLPTHNAKFDLTLTVSETPVGLQASWEYSTDLFDACTIERMAQHFKTLLEGTVADASQLIGQLPLLNEAERQQLLIEWNHTAADYPQDRCIPQLFEEQVARTPEAVAVVFENRELTYGALNARANQLAHHLIGLGVGPEVLVGVCLERSIEMVIALLGILKAGGAYVPLDPTYPPERLAFMLKDSAAPVLVTQQVLAAQLPLNDGDTVCLDWDWPKSATQQEANPASAITGESLAYVIYTSGSTGKPKGVMIEHRSVLNYLLWLQRCFPLTPTDRVLQSTSTSFDISILELFWPLVVGAPMEIAPPGAQRSANELIEFVRRRQISVLQVVPSMLGVIVEGQGITELKSLCRVFTAGEALTTELVRRFHEKSEAHLVNGYGPTETTVYSTFWPCRRTTARTAVPIGRPISNTRIYILDGYGEPVPVGVAGEVYISGAGVARGYLKRPEQTAQRFVPDPFSGSPGGRMYRTGDLARYLPDGEIEFLGRLDQQVKIRGFRIELGEVEAALGEHPAVRQAVVLAREDTPGDKRLVAYIVPADGAMAGAEALRAHLRERLPDYMLPLAYVVLEHLPLTPNGKVDRRALPTPQQERASIGRTPVETDQPANLLELELIRLWRRLFQREDIGRHDNFFDLGGHSLLAARLAIAIDNLLGCKLPIPALFQSPTIESLSRRLTDEHWAPLWSSLVPLQPLGDKPPLFLTHGWGGDVYSFLGLAQQLAPYQPVYGLQAVGLDGKATRHTSVETMAAHYLNEIRSFQSQGPYYVGGYSLGGVIAFEMAQQLHRAGQQVAVLALFDTAPLGGISWPAMALLLRRRCGLHLRRLWKTPNRSRLGYLRGLQASLRGWIAHNRSKPPVVTSPPPAGTEAPEVPGFPDYYAAIASGYRLHPYPGSADIFVSEDTTSRRRLFWQVLVRGGVAFHRVQGSHRQVIEPGYVSILAKELRNVLDRTQARGQAAAFRSRPSHASIGSLQTDA
jgi:amino acid adenylation domain-containing protein